MEQITQAAFEAWLAGKPDEEIVGTGSDPWRCPLAYYLRDQGYAEACVGISHAWINELAPDASGTTLLPWAMRLRALVDGSASWLDMDKGEITAAHLRALLATIRD